VVSLGKMMTAYSRRVEYRLHMGYGVVSNDEHSRCPLIARDTDGFWFYCLHGYIIVCMCSQILSKISKLACVLYA
jgi:hypothetical protein